MRNQYRLVKRPYFKKEIPPKEIAISAIPASNQRIRFRSCKNVVREVLKRKRVRNNPNHESAQPPKDRKVLLRPPMSNQGHDGKRSQQGSSQTSDTSSSSSSESAEGPDGVSKEFKLQLAALGL